MKKKKRIIIFSIVICIFIVIVSGLIRFGYIEYLLDNRKIDRSGEDYSVVVTLTIGAHVLAINPHDTIVQIRSDKTITENTFREIRWEYNPWRIYRTYDDQIIRGRSRTLLDDEYNTILEILRNSDFESIQSKIDSAGIYLDGNSTYISVRDRESLIIVGGHCAEGKDERFQSIVNHILNLLEWDLISPFAPSFDASVDKYAPANH